MGNFFSSSETLEQCTIKNHGFKIIPIPENIQPHVKKLLAQIVLNMESSLDQQTPADCPVIGRWTDFEALKTTLLNSGLIKLAEDVKDGCEITTDLTKFKIPKSGRFQDPKVKYNGFNGYQNQFEKEQISELEKQIDELGASLVNKSKESKKTTEMSAMEEFYLELTASLGTVSERHPFDQLVIQQLALWVFQQLATESDKLITEATTKDEPKDEPKNESKDEQKEDVEEGEGDEDAEESEQDEESESEQDEEFDLKSFTNLITIKNYPKEWMNFVQSKGFKVKDDILPYSDSSSDSIFGLIATYPIKVQLADSEHVVTIPENHMLISLDGQRCEVLNDLVEAAKPVEKKEDEKEDEKEDKDKVVELMGPYRPINYGISDQTQNSSFIVFTQQPK